MQLQDLDADTSSNDNSRKLDRKKRDVSSELPAPELESANDQIETRSDVVEEDQEGSMSRNFPSLYVPEDATASQYGTVQRSARQLRGQTSNQPWPSDYEVVDTPYSSSNNYYNTNKGVAYHNRPSQNIPYIQYAEKSPHSSSKAKKSQNSDILPLLLNGYSLQKQNHHQQQQQVKQKSHHQNNQQYLDDEENSLPDNFSYFHLGKGNSNSNSDKKQSQLKYNYVPNTTPKGAHSNSYIAFSTVGGFYNNQPVTQSPQSNKYLKQQYFTPSDGRFFSNSNSQNGANSNSNSGSGKPSQNFNSNQEENYYSYQSFPSNNNNNDRPIQIGNKPKHPQHQQHYQQIPEKVTPSFNEDEFYPTLGYNKKPQQQTSLFNTNFQSPFVEEVEIKPKRPHYESSTPKGHNQGGFYVTEKPRNVQVVNKNKDKPVYESPESDSYNGGNRKPISSSFSGFDEFLAGIKNTNFQEIKPIFMKNLTLPFKPLSSSTQKPNNEYYSNDDEYYYDDEYEEDPTPRPQPSLPQKPVKTQHSTYINDNNNQYFYSSSGGYQNQNLPSPAKPSQENVNNHFKIPIQPQGHLLPHTTSKPVTSPRPKPLTTTTVRYPAPSTTAPTYATGNSDEYYYDDEDYDYKIPVNASKYMPMSETMAPRPTQPATLQRPHSPYNKYNVHNNNYHYASPVDQSKGQGPVKYAVDTLDNVEDNGTGNEDEYEIDIRIQNNTGTKNQIPSKSVPSILQFPEDYFGGINLRPNNTKHKVKTTELYMNPVHHNNHQPTYRPPSVPTSTMATKISAATVKYTKPYTASSTPSVVTIKQRPTTQSTTTTVTTELPPVPTTRKVYTVRPSRVNQKWRPAKKNKNKTEQLELDERLPNR